MVAGLGRRRDPYWDDGRGARRHNLRVRIQGHLAFSMAVVACGLTLYAWIQVLQPLFHQLGLG
jgi:hypothetical protein